MKSSAAHHTSSIYLKKKGKRQKTPTGSLSSTTTPLSSTTARLITSFVAAAAVSRAYQKNEHAEELAGCLPAFFLCTSYKKSSVRPELQAAAASVLAAGIVSVAANLLLRSSSSQEQEHQAPGEEDGEECWDCGRTGLCGRHKGEGFVFKQLSEDTATKARKAAKNMTTRYTAGLPTKWTYRNNCSFTRGAPATAGGLCSPLALHSKKPRIRVASANSNFTKVLQTAWRVGKDAVKAGTNLVPGSVPRPVARIGVTFAAMSVALFLLKSVVSTAFFVLAMMGLIYLGFLALNPKEMTGSRADEEGGSPSKDHVEEARRIMEKYK